MRLMILGISASAMAAAGVAAAANAPVTPELIRLPDDLRLSSDQEAAWHDYVLAIAPDRNVEARHRAAQDLLPLVPTPRRIALIAANMEQDAADFRRQGEAVKAFYSRLSPDQQRTFDRDTAPNAADPQR